MGEELHEECGIAAVYLRDDGSASNKALFYVYKLLLNMQNRGQLSAGFTTFDVKRLDLLKTYRNLGSVNEVFKTNNELKSARLFHRYAGTKAIGHVRYATCGKEERSYAQPFERFHGRMWKWFAFCFNGNLTNYADLRDQLLKKTDYHITRDTDTEIIMHYISRELAGSKKPDMVQVFHNLSKVFDGAYNIAMINANGDLIATRGPNGIRPLCYAIEDGNLLVASESNALMSCGMTCIKSLAPGEIIMVADGKVEIKRYAESKRKARCQFEWVYFSNVSSVIDDRSVYIVRKRLGEELAALEVEKITKEHVVVPVPDTAKAAGDAYAFSLGIPSVEGLIRNRYVGRTFIEGSSRHDKVQNKYTVIREVLEGKKVLLVDDSVVRGTTLRNLVRYIKDRGGAKEVHLRITCPPIRSPCFYGIDMSTIGELIYPSYDPHTEREELDENALKKMANDLGADSIIYQTIPNLIKAIGLPKSELCLGCLNADYPTPCGRKMFGLAKKAYDHGEVQTARTYEAARQC
ncbi:TPA: amidophosphoribosyltransferase [Candidatus Woesearchaeota archaeon]|nr:amidophosphoribosyltransferase [Candidatus Woesearchaeota archaeon]